VAVSDNATLTQEEVEDFAGALIGDGTGTHTGIAVTYQDASGDVDMVVDHDAATNFVANEHIDHTAVTLTAGAGLGGGGDISDNRSFTTASGEADFLASGALTCGAGTQGKAQIHTTPLQYCDNAATPALQYTAYGDSAGAALTGDTATSFFSSGEIEKAYLPNVEGLDTGLTAARCVRINAGGTALEAAAADCNTSGGADTALSNLAAVAINTALLPDAAAADDFGSATLPFKDLFFAGSSGTPGTNNFRLTGASTSGTRVITAADGASVTVIADSGAANNFLTGITTAGAITKAQPAFTDVSGIAAVTQGGTGRSTGTTAYSLIATGTTATGAQQTLANGATTEILVGGGVSALPVWTTATGTGAPVRASSPALVTPDLGTPSALVGTNITGTGASFTAGTATVATSLGADAVDALTEIAQGIKTAANDTDPLAVFTGGNPAGNRCVEMNATGQLISAADTCANLGPGGTTTIDALGDAGGIGAVAVGVDQEYGQTWTWNPPATTVAQLDALSLVVELDATTDAQVQNILVVERDNTATGAATLESLVQLNNNDADGAVTNAIAMTAAAGTITNAVNMNDAQITNAFVTPNATIAMAELEILDAGTRTDEALCTYESTGNQIECDVNSEATLETALGGALNVVTVTADDITTANLMTVISDEGAANTVLKGDGTWEAESRPFSYNVENPAVGDDGNIQHKLTQASTLVRVSCSTSSGNADINLYERAENSPNTGTTGMLTADLTCNSDTTADSTVTFTDAAIAADSVVALGIKVDGTTGWLRVFVEYTVN
jgi:hypothetical protein